MYPAHWRYGLTYLSADVVARVVSDLMQKYTDAKVIEVLDGYIPICFEDIEVLQRLLSDTMYQMKFKTQAQTPTQINVRGDMLEFKSPYNADLVAAMKLAIPGPARQWDNAAKVWLVTPEYGATLSMLAGMYLGEVVEVPALNYAPRIEVKILDVRYIGACKERGGGRAAFGWSENSWNVVFSEPVLREYFGLDSKPSDSATLYETLGVKSDIAPVEIKKAYYRMVKQWHPDVCHEPNAAEQFKLIQHAYEILNDSIKRAKYDAGLKLMLMDKTEDISLAMNEWRAPLRCGVITCEAERAVNRWNVKKILDWQDIVRDGKTLVTSWTAGADTFTEAWL